MLIWEHFYHSANSFYSKIIVSCPLSFHFLLSKPQHFLGPWQGWPQGLCTLFSCQGLYVFCFFATQPLYDQPLFFGKGSYLQHSLNPNKLGYVPQLLIFSFMAFIKISKNSVVGLHSVKYSDGMHGRQAVRWVNSNLGNLRFPQPPCAIFSTILVNLTVLCIFLWTQTSLGCSGTGNTVTFYISFSLWNVTV